MFSEEVRDENLFLDLFAGYFGGGVVFIVMVLFRFVLFFLEDCIVF